MDESDQEPTKPMLRIPPQRISQEPVAQPKKLTFGPDHTKFTKPMPDLGSIDRAFSDRDLLSSTESGHRRRRSASRRPTKEEYEQKPKNVQISSGPINRVAIILSLLLAVAGMVFGAFLFGRHLGSNSPATQLVSGTPAINAVSGPAIPESSLAAMLYTPPSAEVTEKALPILNEFFFAMMENDFEGAKIKLESAREILPDLKGIEYQMGFLARRMKDPRQALDHIEKSLALGEELYETHLLLGQILTAQNQYYSAYEAFNTAINADPYKPYAFYYWGETLREQGKAHDAVSKLEQAFYRAREQPDAFIIHLKLLLAKVEANDKKLLDTELPAKLADPDAGGEWFMAGAAVALRNNDTQKITEYLQKAKARLQPNFYAFVLHDKFFDSYRTNPEYAELMK